MENEDHYSFLQATMLVKVENDKKREREMKRGV